MKWIYAALLIVCITLLLMLGAVRLEESFVAGTNPVDIAAYLTALREYNALYDSKCKINGNGEGCSLYRAAGSADKSTYRPPDMSSAGTFRAAVAAWNGTGAMPKLSPGDFSVLPTSETLNAQYEFAYYAAAPRGNMRFINNIAQNTVLTPWELWLNNQVNVWRSGTTTDGVTYGTYLNIGGVNYDFVKAFVTETNVDTPIHTLALTNKTTGQVIRLGYTNKGAIRGVSGTILDNSFDALELMLRSGNQIKFNEDFDAIAVVAVASSSSSAAVVPVASSSAAPIVEERRGTKGADGGLLDLPELTYYEDAWYRNRMLFAKMYGAVPNPADEVKRYYQSAGAAAEGQSYELTALKFLELDRLILKSVTANGVVNVERLRGLGGTYNLEVPFPYDPAMYDIMNTMEEPSAEAKGLKCYSMNETQAKIISYFGKRPFENLAATNLQLMAKFRANLCASYGYYSKDNLETCTCEGCCIPVSYATKGGFRRTNEVGAAAQAAEAKKVLGSGDAEGCIYTSRAYRLKKRQLPLGVEESDVCVKEGFATRTFTEDVEAAKATAGVAKGWRLFEQRVVPAFLPGGETNEGFEDDCLTPSLPSPYRLRRGKPKLMTCV
jgi:hypothetical protein